MSEPWRRARETAAHLGVARSTLLALVKREGLPAVVASGGAGQRRILLFRLSDVDRWLEARRERQLRATIDGDRYASRRRAS